MDPLPAGNLSRCYWWVAPSDRSALPEGEATMGHYKSNLRDIEFNLFEVLGRDQVMGSGPFAEMDVDTARSVLDEVARLAETELAETFAEADRNPPVFDPATH